MGMSATPVINNLQEGRSLIELITGVEHEDLPTRTTVSNCMRMHQQLVRLGIRWMPEYDLVDEEIIVEVDCADVLDEVVAESVKARQLSGFYRTPEGDLAIRGRHVKAMIKEAANIAYAKDRWGPTKKGTRSFFAEHVFVQEDWIPLGRTEPDGIDQRFVSTWRGTGISYDEYVEDAKIGFTVVTDHKFTKDQWATIWVIAERNGLGAARSQGFGTFEVTRWDKR